MDACADNSIPLHMPMDACAWLIRASGFSHLTIHKLSIKELTAHSHLKLRHNLRNKSRHFKLIHIEFRAKKLNEFTA